MAIIYSYPLNDNIKPLDELVGTTEKNINGQLKTVTRNFLLQDLAEFFIVDGGLQKTITLTTNNVSGAATLNQTTGILNIPNYSEGIVNSPITIENDSSLFSTGLTGTGDGSNATNSIFFGSSAGTGATNANYSNFFGRSAGEGATGASHSNLLGLKVGASFTDNNIGSNNIIIGTNISLPDATANSLNIGGILFGTGTYSDIVSDTPSITPTSEGKIGIGVVEPTNTLHIYSEAEDTSGLRLERLTSSSPTSTGQVIGVDANGNVVTVEGGGGGSQDLQSVTDIGATTTNTITANSITTTIDSTINGVRVGRGNITGNVSENTAVGYQALQSVVHTTGDTGYYNTAFGDKALKSLTSGYANDAFGDAALNLCTTGTFNLAIGNAAMLNSTTATQNTAVGQYALQNSISGQKNTAIGLSALGQNTASYNTAIGSYAGGAVSSTGTENILVGYQAGAYITSGRNNLLIENVGSNASITSGSYNIILNPKQRSGVTTGSNNTIIGCFDNTFATGLTSNVIIANGLGSIRFQSTDTGLTTVPAQTNTLINGDATGKAVVTKEYLTNSQTVFVPYTGATTDVNLGLNDITAAKLIKDGGFDYQFLKADGSVDNNTYLTSTDLPSTLDLYATTSPDPVIAGYTALVRNIADSRYNTTAVDVPTPLVDGTLAAPTLCGVVISDPSVLLGNPGVFNFTVIGNIRRVSGSTSSGADFFYKIYKRDLAGTEVFISESAKVPVPANGGFYIEYISTALWNNGIFLSTDRIVLKFYGIQTGGGTGAYYEFLFGGSDPVRGTAAISSAIIPNIYLKDLADVEKTPALDNEILYWNDPASLWEHSLAENLVPLATATQKGLVSTTTQTFAGAKTFSGSVNIENSLYVSTNTDIAINAISQDSDAISAEAVNGTGVFGSSTNGLGGYFNTVNGANIAEFRTNFVLKAAIQNDGKITATAGTASTDVVVKSQLDTKQNTITLSAIGSVPNADAATLTGSVLNLQPADATYGGVVTTGTQTFAGAKTFTSIGSTAITGNSTEQNGITGNSVSSTGIAGTSIDDVGVYGGSINAIGGVFNTVNGTTIVEFQTNSVLKATVNSDGLITGTGLNASGQTINTIASFDANKNVVSLPTATYPSLTELALVKGVSGSSIQTQLDGKVDENTAIIGATKTKITYDSKGLVTAGADIATTDISDFNSATRAQVEAELVAGTNITITPSGTGATRQLTIASTGGGSSTLSPFTMLANNSDVNAIPTQQIYKDIAEQTYSLTPVWVGTAPTTIVANTYQWKQVGSLVTVRVNLIYSTAGSITRVFIALPADMPTPFVTSELNNASAILYYGVGMFNALSTSVATVGRVCYLAKNATNTGFEFAIIHSTAVSSRVISLTLQYFT